MRACLLFVFALVYLSRALAEPDTDASQAALARMEARVAERPDDATLRYFLAARRAATGDADGALVELRLATAHADGFLPIDAELFPALAARADYRALRAELERRLPRVVTGAVFHRMRERDLLPEGLAWDPVSGRTFVTSMRRGSVTALEPDGEERPFLGDGPAPLIGAAIEAANGRLHVVRSNAFTTAGTARINRIETYALDDARLLLRVDIADGVLNDVTPGGEGVLFASDSAGGRVWRIEQGRAIALLPIGTLPGANGLAFDATRGALFVAHSTGVARLDADGAGLVPRLPLPPREQASAIDGLYLYRGDLVGIQNLTTPGRVVRLVLDAEGQQVTALRTLQSHHQPEFDEPTTGALVGSTLRMLATTQVSRLQPDGSVRDPATLKPAVLLDVPLD